jgi:hypothetical protein
MFKSLGQALEKQPAQEYAADQQQQIRCTGRDAVGARQQRVGRFA